MKKIHGCLSVLLSLCACFLLAACAGKGASEVTPEIVYEPEAQEAAPPLTPEEVTALKSTGEIDKDLSSTAMADVTKQYRYYLRSGRAVITTSLKRGQQYFPYARSVFQKRGLPEDLAYLAIVESGCRADVTSRAGAAGAWQFMKETGASFGLDKDAWTDDRLDIYEATEAAASYLEKLHREFRDWPTAIAAYNAGQGKIRRAMEASGGRNFFEVRERNETLPEKLQLKEETKQYVPRFLAVVKIMRNLNSLNFTLPSEGTPVNVTRVAAKPGTDLKSFSRSLSIDWGDFCLLNKHHQQNAITSAVRDTYVYVPEDRAQQAQALLAARHQGEYAGWRTCRIDKPQTWKKLEKRYHVSAEKLRAVNPGCSLKTGDLVFLPDNAATIALSTRPMQQTQLPQKYSGSGPLRMHTLAANETLYSVARRFQVSPSILMQYNGISDPSSIPAGKVLRIPASGSGLPPE